MYEQRTMVMQSVNLITAHCNIWNRTLCCSRYHHTPSFRVYNI